MWTRLRICGLSSLLLAAPLVASASSPTVGESRAVETGDLADLSERLQALVRDPSPAAAAQVSQHVEKGLPPGALMALLEGLRAHPRSDLLGVVLDLTGHRRPAVRSRAVDVLAAYGEPWRHDAVLVGFDDHDLSVRATACRLAAAHPRPEYMMPLVRMAERGEVAAGPALLAVGRKRLAGTVTADGEDTEAFQVLLVVEGLASHPQPDVRVAAIELLASRGGVAGVEIVARGLLDLDAVVRNRSMLLVQDQPDPSHFPRLLELLSARDSHAADAMAAVVAANPELLAALREALEDQPEELRSRALGALLKNPDFGPTRERLNVRRVLALTDSPTSRDQLRMLAQHGAGNPWGGL